MPLMMIAGSTAPLPPARELFVPGGEARSLAVGQGQLLAIRDLEGGQPAGLFAASPIDPTLFLSPHHTRVFSNSFVLRLGMRLVTNKRRPVMVLGVSEPHLRHDLLMPLTEASVRGETGGADALREIIARAFARAGLKPDKIADPVNLFLDVSVGLDGSLTPRGVSSRPGDAVVFRVVADLVVAVASPHADPKLWDRANPGPIAVRVCNEVSDLDDWTKTRR